jgi:pilus assembly protein Flp/PilA
MSAFRGKAENICSPRVFRLLTQSGNRDASGTAIEYGLTAAGISLAIIGAVNGNLSTKFWAIKTSLKYPRPIW